MSRLCVKNLPKYLSEEDFRKHFAAKGEVTDAKLMKTGQGRSRRFGFVGYRTEKAAEEALAYFNNSFINMSKIVVEKAIPYGSEDLNRPWSKYSTGSSAFEKVHGSEKKQDEFQVEETDAFREQQQKMQEHVNTFTNAENDPKLQEFLGVMAARSKGKTWANDDLTVLEKSKDQDVVKQIVADSDDDLYDELPSKQSGTKEDNDNGDDDKMDEDNVKLNDETASGSRAMDVDEHNPHVRNQAPMDVTEQIEDTGRLFVRNLAYTCTEDDLRELFSRYGSLAEIHMPISKDTKRPKGFAYVTFTLPEHAVKAHKDMDMKNFQGRLIHILPSKEKPQQKEEEILGPNGMKMSKFKQQKELDRKKNAGSEFNWNSLYMSSDAVAESIANRLGIDKATLLNPNADNMAVRLALAETEIVNETKKFFEQHGIVLDAFGDKTRSDTILLVKNTPYGTSEDDMRELFGRFGELGRVLVPPAKTMAVVEFLEPSEARAALKQLAYRRYKDTLLYLEKAPSGLFKDKFNPEMLKKTQEDAKQVVSGADFIAVDQGDVDESNLGTLFVKNLNFKTTPDRLQKAFMGIEGYRSSRIKVKPDAKNPGKTLSMGFGFIEFKTKEFAEKALRAMQGYTLDGHVLQLKFSNASASATSTKTEKKPETTKLMVRNIPFEATKKDLQELFGTHGKMESVRLPNKATGGHRGFAFLNFSTKQEAKNVYDSMGNIHLYGRHLVLEWANEDEGVDALREKTGKSFAKEERIGGRLNKKRKVEVDEGEEEF
ncbi:hypothetical protein BDB00DRAFT_962913 [Zychaea mexicana]|uniref:uncharacterized protein n=1 Tax=Zychaea mexicana TaxID=64656 RepID=UPI0022FEDFF5|nr:uncharacterized protein BDB00DRAFT_962913 [Zychaea mexicana]KAI9489053.1 hypothetical protein BDB00DRAFT_962913 [Zychaea mexicana]